MTRCGYANCRCRADPPQLHGPYHQWTRKIAGKTVTRILSDDQLADYQPWLDNQRRLHALITELETLSQEIADQDPRWQPLNQDHVDAARLTCGQPPASPKSPAHTKREHLTTSQKLQNRSAAATHVTASRERPRMSGASRAGTPRFLSSVAVVCRR